MRIAIFDKTFLRGGAEKQALILAKLLSENGMNVCLINWFGDKADPGHIKFIDDNSIRYFALRGTFMIKFFRFLKILKRENISIVLSYLTLANFISGLSKVFAGNVLTIGGIRNERLPYIKFLFEKWIHNYLNDATVFNNYSGKDKFTARGFKPEKISVIHNAIECKPIIEKTHCNGSVIKVVSVARFVRQKDYYTALVSFKKLLEDSKDASLIYYIIGYGPLENDLRSFARQLDLTGNIKFIINPPDIYSIIQDCDIFLSTSIFEGLSNSIMEAMSAGLPVVATDVGDNRYLVKNDINGFLVPAGDAQQITNKLKCLTESEILRKEFGKNSRRIIESDFSNGKLISDYLKLFSEVKSSIE